MSKAEHFSQDLMWQLSDLACHVEAFSHPMDKPMLGETVRYSDRVREDDGYEYRSDRQAEEVIVFPIEDSFDRLITVFNRVGIVHEVTARHVETMDGQPPRKPVDKGLMHAFIKVNLTQPELAQKIRKGTLLAITQRHAAMLKQEVSKIAPDESAMTAEEAAFVSAELTLGLQNG